MEKAQGKSCNVYGYRNADEICLFQQVGIQKLNLWKPSEGSGTG